MSNDEYARGAWHDRWLVSMETEELERIGLTGQGRAIIEELNRVYERTGILRRFAKLLLAEARAVFVRTQQAVRLLDVGVRDGALLHLVAQEASQEGIPLDLHGIEFREDILAYAQQRCAARGDHITPHHDSTRVLAGLAEGSFDIVCSTFMLHHLTSEESARLLANSSLIARFSVVHLDLKRSLAGVALIWMFYSLFRHTLSRSDSVLSCRRAFKVRELKRLLGADSKCIRVHRVFPLYLMVERRIGSLQ